MIYRLFQYSTPFSTTEFLRQRNLYLSEIKVVRVLIFIKRHQTILHLSFLASSFICPISRPGPWVSWCPDHLWYINLPRGTFQPNRILREVIVPQNFIEREDDSNILSKEEYRSFDFWQVRFQSVPKKSPRPYIYLRMRNLEKLFLFFYEGHISSGKSITNKIDCNSTK